MNNKTEMDNKKFGPKEIKQNLIDAALFLAYYEILKSVILGRINSFYNIEIEEGKRIISDNYKKEIIDRIINGKKIGEFKASCIWLIENGALSPHDHVRIEYITELRNRIAHDIPKYLFDSDYSIDSELFTEIKSLTLKTEKWWIINVDIPCNSDFDNQIINEESIVPGYDTLLSYIFNIANSDLEELEKIIG
jgi:hypothetical protein